MIQVAANLIQMKMISYIALISIGELPKFVNVFSICGSILSILVVQKFPRHIILLTSLVIIITKLGVMSYILVKCGQFLKVFQLTYNFGTCNHHGMRVNNLYNSNHHGQFDHNVNKDKYI